MTAELAELAEAAEKERVLALRALRFRSLQRATSRTRLRSASSHAPRLPRTTWPAQPERLPRRPPAGLCVEELLEVHEKLFWTMKIAAATRIVVMVVV